MLSFIKSLNELGYRQLNENFFDTLKIEIPASVSIGKIEELAVQNEINFRYTGQKIYWYQPR